MLLYVVGLLWWGEAAVAEENAKALLEDWKVAVLDVALVLGRATEAVRVCKRYVKCDLLPRTDILN
jgi:hypothetical protein